MKIEFNVDKTLLGYSGLHQTLRLSLTKKHKSILIESKEFNINIQGLGYVDFKIFDLNTSSNLNLSQEVKEE